MEIGELTLEEWFAGVQDRAPEILGQAIDMDAYLRFMAEMPVGVHWAVVHRARALRADGVPIALLTNNVAEWGTHWRSSFPVDELFEVVVDSSAVKMRKPDPRIYLLTCEEVGVDPATCVFVDDNADNIAAARGLGMETVHFGEDPFASLDELDAILDRRGVKPRA
jgi:putative hydrolase of the HAD superfamily